MVDITSIRNRIQTKVFDGLGSTMLVSSVITSSTNKWGDATTTYATATTEKCVPYNIMFNKSYEPFGDLQSYQLDLVITYTSVAGIDSSIRYNSTNYLVNNIESFTLKDGILAKVMRISEIR